jgi:hypothetical protein
LVRRGRGRIGDVERDCFEGVEREVGLLLRSGLVFGWVGYVGK